MTALVHLVLPDRHLELTLIIKFLTQIKSSCDMTALVHLVLPDRHLELTLIIKF